MIQQGQVFKLTAKGADGQPLWAYRYRLEGRSSARPQVGGFATRVEAQKALRKALDRVGPGRGGATTLAELVEEYLELHQAEPVTIAKLRWLLGKATGALGEKRIADMSSKDVYAWRLTVPEGVGCRNSVGAGGGAAGGAFVDAAVASAARLVEVVLGLVARVCRRVSAVPARRAARAPRALERARGILVLRHELSNPVPAGRSAAVRAKRPIPARRAQPGAAAPLVAGVHRAAGDALALASPARRQPLDVPASTTRPAADRWWRARARCAAGA